jgi:chromosome segregation ATPase
MGQLEPRIAKAEGEIIQVNNGVSGLKTDLATLKKAADDLEQLSKTAKDAQINMERIADNVNKANLDQAALTKRVATNEEWIESINAFRKQVNGNINRLETQLRAMQSTPSPAQSNQ